MRLFQGLTWVLSAMSEVRAALIAGDAHPEMARALSNLTGVVLVPATVSSFADGESRVRIEGDVSQADVYLVQPTSPPVNEHLMTLALLADAARSAGAVRVTAIVPYFGYARQDVRKTPGEPRSGALAARLLRVAGVDRLVTLELHSPVLESAFEMPVVQLDADPATLPLVRGWRIEDLVIVAPDAGGLKRAQRYAAALDADLAAVAKVRPKPDLAVARQVLGNVRGRECLIVDDLASTGGTVVGAAQALMDAGAKAVHALFVHPVMAPQALERMCAAPIQRLVSTDSVASTPNPRLLIVSVAPLLAQAVRRPG